MNKPTTEDMAKWIQENRPVEHAVASEACTKCGAPVGVSCKVEVQGRLHDGAHRARLDAAYPRSVG